MNPLASLLLFSSTILAAPLEIPYFSSGSPVESTINSSDVSKDLEISQDHLSLFRKDKQFNINVNWGFDPKSEIDPEKAKLIETDEDLTFNGDNGPLDFGPSDIRFSATNSAFWVNELVNLVTGNGYLKSSPMEITIYGQCEDDLNAYYDPKTNYICIGHLFKSLGRNSLAGMTSLGLDGDVISHEMGHGILHHLMNRPEMLYKSYDSDMFSAMHEGQADFFAYLTTGTQALGPWLIQIQKEYFLKLKPEFYPAFKDKTSFRPIANNYNLRENFFENDHDNGSILAGTLLDIAKEIGNKKALSLWLYAASKLTESDDFYDDANLMLEADSILFNGENSPRLKAIFTKRGIFNQGSPHDPLKNNELKLAYKIDDNGDHAQQTLGAFGLLDGEDGKGILEGMNNNGQLDPGECALVEMQFSNTGDRELVGLEMFVPNNMVSDGLKNKGQNRIYFGFLNPGKTFPDDSQIKFSPWLFVCADNTYTSGGTLPIMVKNLSVGSLTFNVKL